MQSDPTPNPTPLSEAAFFILLSLATGPKHGYAVLKDVEELSRGQVSLSTSTLYTVLNRLLNRELIDRTDPGQNEAGPGLPRKVYRLNERGRRILNAEARRIQLMLVSYQKRLGEERV